MFRSSEAAYFPLNWPVVLTTPVTPGDPIAITFTNSQADVHLFLEDGDGNVVVPYVSLNSLPTGVTLEANFDLSPTIKATSAFLGANSAGTWRAVLRDSVSGAVTPVTSCQWGGTVDLLYQGAADATNAYGDTQAIKQATLGACTFDPTTGYVTFWSSGDHFRLIDSNGAAVSSPQNATGRDNTTQ